MLRILPILFLLSACLPLRPLTVGDLVISDDQVWSKTVIISGVVRVTSTGSLTLKPGTRLLFRHIDRDADGIGDAELRVEGRMRAIGSREQPILLTSAEKKPAVADWKFLYFDYAEQVELNYLVSEYAYSGIQVHFCRARIENSEFRYNVDGVRFSTANILLTGSYLHDNRHGIRYEERGGKGIVRNNRISNNKVGIFAVTRAAGKTLFEQNNIVGNRPYQVKLGLGQTGPLDFPRNWWGDVNGLSIRTVIDQRKDSSLGRVSASAPLAAPVALGKGSLYEKNNR